MTEQLETIEDTAGLDRLRPEWDALLEASDTDGLFLTPEWLFTWWKHLGDGHRLRVVTVRAGGELVAVAPFVVRPARLDRQPSFRCLELLGSGEVGSDYLDVIVRRGHEAQAVGALADGLASGREVVALRRLRRSPCFAATLASALARSGWTVVDGDDESSRFIRFGGASFAGYLAGLGSAHRQAFRRKLRGLERRHRVELERVDGEAGRPAGMAALVALHQERWRGLARSEAFSRPELVSFHEEMSRLALTRGWLRLFLLRVDGAPVAALHGYRYRDVFYYYQSGYDPAFARHSVGLVLLGLAIRSAIEEGVVEFDLLHGEERYKRHWARQARPLHRLELYPPGARGWLYRGATVASRCARRLARAVVSRPRAARRGGRP